MGEMYVLIKLAEDVLMGLHYLELFLQRQRLQLHELKLSFIRRLGMGNKTCFTRLIGREQNVIGRVRNWVVRVRENLLISLFRSAWTGEGERKNNSKFTDPNHPISDSVTGHDKREKRSSN